ncbi:MAG: hypothetical protein IKM45_04900, partial [Opitutales bacterium]|nr:hypothetical protein [Opitutales bacterium]
SGVIQNELGVFELSPCFQPGKRFVHFAGSRIFEKFYLRFGNAEGFTAVFVKNFSVVEREGNGRYKAIVFIRNNGNKTIARGVLRIDGNVFSSIASRSSL